MTKRKASKDVNGGAKRKPGSSKPSARRKLDRRTRRPSKSIPLRTVKKLDRGWRHAQTLGLGCNVFLTLKPRHIDALTPLERQACWDKYRDRIGQFARREGFPPTYIWSRESGRDTGLGEHLHVLIHIPPELQARFERMCKRWASHPDEVHLRPANYKVRVTEWGHRHSARAYITKNSHQASRYWNETWKPGGPILGKRVGCTRNLEGRARAQFQAARRVRPASPPQPPAPLF